MHSLCIDKRKRVGILEWWNDEIMGFEIDLDFFTLFHYSNFPLFHIL
jgi:hypothetical protein